MMPEQVRPKLLIVQKVTIPSLAWRVRPTDQVVAMRVNVGQLWVSAEPPQPDDGQEPIP
jgi:hypothetical protein